MPKQTTPAPTAVLGPALAAFYDDCTYWAAFARQKEEETKNAKETPKK